MNIFKNSTVIFSIVVGLGVSSATYAENFSARKCNLTVLKLTDAQKKQIKEFRPEKRPSKDEMRKEWVEYRLQTEAIIQQKNFNEKKAEDLINHKFSREADVQLEILRARHALFQILDDKQKAIWLRECSL